MGTILSPRGTSDYNQLIIEIDDSDDPILIVLRRGNPKFITPTDLALSRDELIELSLCIDDYIAMSEPITDEDGG